MRKLAFVFLFVGLLHTCSGRALAQGGFGGAEGGGASAGGGVEPAGPAQAPGSAAPTDPKFSGTLDANAIEGGGDLNAVINPNNIKPKTLDEAIQRALSSNPDIALAEANLRQAQAAYEQAKLKVTNQVMIAMEKAEVDRLELDRVNTLRQQGVISEEEVRAARFESRKSELELDYLLGVAQTSGRAGLPEHFLTPGMKWGTILDFHGTLGGDAGGGASTGMGSAGGGDGAEGTGGGGAAPAPGPGDKIRDALESRSPDVELQVVPLNDLAVFLADAIGVPVIVDTKAFAGIEPESLLVSLELRGSEFTFKDVLQAISDTHDVGFLVRDYGILITSPTKAAAGQLGGGGFGGGGGGFGGGGAMGGSGGGFF